ncbi:LapA family protein [Thalassobacillus pellis]|uniref:LapA family protein n=1 Tax=Thalassobacillus pellis TaxID=748008 RepID=UPI00195F90BE|nr:lipopolysaccharide assembly protein LapA domain-containing protein [Thalassobacillus pellis]MBM7554650.1 putative integral membrane protein [Thalassobacillus pellis]
MKAQSYWILALLFALLIAIFAVINVDPVEVNYLFGTGEAPLIIIILASVLMGGIVTAAAGSVRVFRLKKEVRHLKNSKKADKTAIEESNDYSEGTKGHAGDSEDFSRQP